MADDDVLMRREVVVGGDGLANDSGGRSAALVSGYAGDDFDDEYRRLDQNGIVQPLLTDLYQITMAYAYWKSSKTKDHAIFDLFFRKNPFQGEFTIFAGLGECLKFLQRFHYSDSDIKYLKQTLPQTIEDEFFDYLSRLTADEVTLYAMEEGSVAFPRVPLIRVEGPLIIVQLLETTFLTLVNYASLMATNAARYRMAAGDLKLLEFGLRRAQGPDGGLSASKYSYIGGFDGTSNVLAGKLFNIPVRGTHAHAYITSFTCIDELRTQHLAPKRPQSTTTRAPDASTAERDLLQLAITWRTRLVPLLKVVSTEANDGELAALISFAIAFPDGFMALVDTYDVKKFVSQRALGRPHAGGLHWPVVTLNSCAPVAAPAAAVGTSAITAVVAQSNNNTTTNTTVSNTTTNTTTTTTTAAATKNTSKSYHHNRLTRPTNHHLLTHSHNEYRSGLLNFCAVALALNDLGYRAIGIRIDSGDLAYLSNVARQYFVQIAEQFSIPWFADLMIMASNDINEETILSLNEQGHKINCFGIGTHLVTCQRQPALGCVYKMVELNGQPRIKLSQDVGKVTMPGCKDAYRLYSQSGDALIDLLQRSVEKPPEINMKVLCRHPFEESKRAYVIPSKVEKLHRVHWKDGQITFPLPDLIEIRDRVKASLRTIRPDIKRNLNPTPFKVAVSDNLYNYLHELWLKNAPIGELS